jgi:hypothetical protein
MVGTTCESPLDVRVRARRQQESGGFPLPTGPAGAFFCPHAHHANENENSRSRRLLLAHVVDDDTA